MELFANIGVGLDAALSLQNLFYCFVGVFLGTLIGVLPGLGPLPAIAMLLPVTFGLPAESALIMLSGIYYGAQYGGSTTAILVNLPGESSSVVTALDGHQMARNGRAGVALATAAIASFVAGCFATLLIALFAPPLAQIALHFNAPEYFALMLLGLVASVVIAGGSPVKAGGMIMIGLLLGLVGTDVFTSAQRLTFGLGELSDGINFVVVAMGLFGVGEVIRNLEDESTRRSFVQGVQGLWPTRADFRRMAMPIVRGSLIGSALGLLPGGGALLASFGAYALEKKVSGAKDFGKGAIEGVAAPESANNAGAQTSFVPMLTLGIPSNPIMGLMIGAMIIQGIQPGPGVMTEQPSLFWGLIVSMWIGNLMLVILNLPLVGMWAYVLRLPYHLLFPAILVFCCIGIYALGTSTFEVYLMALFGVLGYFFAKLGCEPAPLLLGFILGPLMEENLRRSLQLSRGDLMVFVERPGSAAILALTLLTLALILLPAFKRTREQAFQEGT